MKYVANPVVVDAFKIVEVGKPAKPTIDELEVILNHGGQPVLGFLLRLDDGAQVVATPEMTSRMTPAIGDYWVIQSDGYIYLNPKEVFERKYSPLANDEAQAAS